MCGRGRSERTMALRKTLKWERRLPEHCSVATTVLGVRERRKEL